MIRSIFLIGLALLASLRSFAAGEVERLALVAKSWGIVKYYHPALASDRINADSLLLTMLQQVDDAGAEKTAADDAAAVRALAGNGVRTVEAAPDDLRAWRAAVAEANQDLGRQGAYTPALRAQMDGYLRDFRQQPKPAMTGAARLP